MEFLYCLQNIRLVCPGWLNLALMAISESVIILAPLFVTCFYWSFDRKKGTYMLCTLLSALFFNELLKVTFCIYRPWILDTRIVPAAEVLHTATNYSFPSSHSTASAAAVFSMIFSFPGRKRRSVCGIVFVLLVMLSRMYLGCHTLKDVCCGSAVGICTALLFRPMLSGRMDEDSFTRRILPVSAVMTVSAIIYILSKSYPLDYDSTGKLLVDPALMVPDALGICGCIIGPGLGFFLERKFISFPMPVNSRDAIRRILVGAAVIAVLYFLILRNLLSGMPKAFSRFLLFFTGSLYICAGYPAVIRKSAALKNR